MLALQNYSVEAYDFLSRAGAEISNEERDVAMSSSALVQLKTYGTLRKRRRKLLQKDFAEEKEKVKTIDAGNDKKVLPKFNLSERTENIVRTKRPKMAVVLTSIQKSCNILNIVRSAEAFGAQQVFHKVWKE
mmetsp:Transcript_17627/g.26412  ORF Transcript_17627/g.26412 Transcript_17627/m.26412 type:complete len:132 (+) Transcript_17627:554-949(+)